jgi:outer membrane protein
VKKLPCVLFVSVLLFGVSGMQAQGQRIGYVNSSKIFQELPAAQEAQKRIDAISKPLQDSLEAMQKDLQSRYEDYQKKEALMNDATKKSEQQRLVDLERHYNEFRVEKFGQDGAVAKETEKIINPIREKIKTAIGQVAREEKYNFIFDKTEQIQILLYGDPAHDMTFKVIDKLKRGK